MLLRITCLGLFAWALFAEMALISTPQSENSDAVGQWGPLIASVLVASGAGLKNWLDTEIGKRNMIDAELGRLKAKHECHATPATGDSPVTPIPTSYGWP